MQIKHQANLAEKEVQIQGITDLHKDDPKIDQFITEALGLNVQPMHQKELLCQKISQWNYYCKTSDKLTSQVVEMRLEYDEIFKRVSDFITWQNSEDGRKAYFSKLEESHKHLYLKRQKRATTGVAATTNSVIKNINENLHSANLVA